MKDDYLSKEICKPMDNVNIPKEFGVQPSPQSPRSPQHYYSRHSVLGSGSLPLAAEQLVE